MIRDRLKAGCSHRNDVRPYRIGLALLFLVLLACPHVSVAQGDGKDQALEVLRRSAEVFDKFTYTSTRSAEKPDLADSLQKGYDQFLSEHPEGLQALFGEKATKLRELLTGFARLASTLAKVELDFDAASNREGGLDEMLKLGKPLNEGRQRFNKAFQAIRRFFMDEVPAVIRDRLSPAAYYVLGGPNLKSEDSSDLTVDAYRFVMPDFDFGSECLVGNYFQSSADIREMRKVVDAGLASAGDDPEKQLAVYQSAKSEKYASIQPGDTIFAIRARSSQNWLYVSDWKQLAKKANYFAVTLGMDKVDLLVGHSKGEARPVPALLW